MTNELKTYFGKDVFETIIHRNVKLAESPSYGKPALLYDVKSTGAKNYIALAQEMISRNGASVTNEGNIEGERIEKNYFG